MKNLIKGLREFKSSYFCSHQDLFGQLAQAQEPRVLFITCSDSRIDPNLLTQSKPGELFVIRNAGNIIPPYGATNGGEGATIEYAIHALNVEHVIVCGHSNCGAMKGLFKLSTLEKEMPLVHAWLTHAEATRRLIKENYSHLEGEELLDVTIAENVLTQIENLKTYPAVHSRLYQGTLTIYAWIYDLDTGDVMAFDADRHAYISPQSLLPESDLDEDLRAPAIACALPNASSNGNELPIQPTLPIRPTLPIQPNYPFAPLSAEQAERIYRGSAPRNTSKPRHS